MQKKRISRLIGLLVLFAVLITSSVPVAAEGGTLMLRIKNTSLVKGDSFRVVIELSAAAAGITSFGPLELSYDPSMFTFNKAVLLTDYTSGLTSNAAGGVVTMTWYHPDGGSLPLAGATYLVGVYFTADQTGSATFQIPTSEGFADQDLNTLYVTAGNSLSVTVANPTPKSADNSLASLQVSPGALSPAFDPATTRYTMGIDMGVDKVTVSATPADSKASVSVSGNTGLIDGDNTIKVVVTAENGDKKTYTIVATRLAATPTPSPSPTPAVTVQLPDGVYAVSAPPPETPIPGGFYSTLVTLGGQSVPAYKALKGDLTLYYLTLEGGQSGFYYLNASSGEYNPFLALVMPAQSFPVLMPDSPTAAPAGYTETTLELNGQTLPAWLPAGAPAEPEEYLLYLMNLDGEKAFYVYDTKSELLSLYKETAAPQETTVTPGGETTVPSGEAPATPAPFDVWQLTTIMLGALCLILAGVVIWLAVRSRRRDDGPSDTPPPPPTIRRVE